MHTIEALLALMIIIGVVTFAARSAPQETQVESSVDTQLVLYGEDFLSILDMEREDHTSWLYDQVNGTVNGGEFNNFCENFSDQWNQTNLTDKKSIFYRVELLNSSSYEGNPLYLSDSPYGKPPQNAVTVTRLVTLVESGTVKVYEVRLTLWYI
jgi:type II secretory pathway pseudopilin PulG